MKIAPRQGLHQVPQNFRGVPVLNFLFVIFFFFSFFFFLLVLLLVTVLAQSVGDTLTQQVFFRERLLRERRVLIIIE